MKESKKKILFRIGSLRGGGAERVLISFLKDLNYEKYEVHLCLNIRHGVYVNDVPKQVKIIYLAMGKEFVSSFILSQFLNKIRNILFYKIYTLWPRILYGSFLDKDYDIEIAFLQGLIPDIVKSPIKKSKKIGWVHFDLNRVSGKKRIIKAIPKLDKVVGVSKMVLDVIKKRLPDLDTHKQYLIYNPIDIEDIKKKALEPIVMPKGEQPIVITAGTLAPYKGHDRLIRAHKRLQREGLLHTLVILGTIWKPKYKSYLINLIEKEKVGDSVHILDFQKNPFPYFKQSDIFVLSSRAEGFSLVVAEALCLGLPVVSTRVVGPVELLKDGEYGLIVKNNTDGIYKGLKAFLIEPEIRMKYALKAPEAVAPFASDKIVERLDSFLQSF